MDWINTVMLVTGYLWWGALGVLAICFLVVTVMEKLFGREPYPRNKDKEDTEETFYYDHDYTAPIGVVVRDESYDTKDGVNFYAVDYPPLTKPKDDDNFI